MPSSPPSAARRAWPRLLLVGVDTDTDAINVHVPDAAGGTDVDRFVSSATLYEQTASLA